MWSATSARWNLKPLIHRIFLLLQLLISELWIGSLKEFSTEQISILSSSDTWIIIHKKLIKKKDSHTIKATTSFRNCLENIPWVPQKCGTAMWCPPTLWQLVQTKAKVLEHFSSPRALKRFPEHSAIILCVWIELGKCEAFLAKM